MYWLFLIHNKVNVSLGKPKYNYNNYIIYLNKLETGEPFTKKYRFYLIIIIGIIGYFLFKYKENIQKYISTYYNKIYYKMKYSIR